MLHMDTSLQQDQRELKRKHDNWKAKQRKKLKRKQAKELQTATATGRMQSNTVHPIQSPAKPSTPQGIASSYLPQLEMGPAPSVTYCYFCQSWDVTALNAFVHMSKCLEKFRKTQGVTDLTKDEPPKEATKTLPYPFNGGPDYMYQEKEPSKETVDTRKKKEKGRGVEKEVLEKENESVDNVEQSPLKRKFEHRCSVVGCDPTSNKEHMYRPVLEIGEFDSEHSLQITACHYGEFTRPSMLAHLDTSCTIYLAAYRSLHRDKSVENQHCAYGHSVSSGTTKCDKKCDSSIRLFAGKPVEKNISRALYFCDIAHLKEFLTTEITNKTRFKTFWQERVKKN